MPVTLPGGRFLQGAGLSNWESADPAATSAYAEAMGKNMPVPTRKLSALRMLARHLVRERIRKDDFTGLTSAPKFARKLPVFSTRMKWFDCCRLFYGYANRFARPRNSRAFL